MRKVRMNKKSIVEYLIGKLVVFILECVIGTGLFLGFFWCIGILEQFMGNSHLGIYSNGNSSNSKYI